MITNEEIDTIIVCLMGALLFQFGMVPVHAAEVDVLINKLVEKGLLSREEATQLLRDMPKEGARQETTVKETAEKVAKETATNTVKKETSGLAKLPSWVSRIHFKGDFRLRYEYQHQDYSDGPEIEATRPLQYGTALVLIFLVLGLNLIAIVYRSRLRKKR